MNRRSGRSRRPQRNESFLSNLREWVSDNLRYILIAAAALIVALIVIFAVKASNDKKTAAEEASQAAVTGTPAQTEWKKGPTTTITVTPSASGSSGGSQTAAAGYPSLDVPGTVITYLDAVAYGDVDTAAAYSEHLDDSTIAVIEGGHPFSEFSSIYVYEYPGAKSGEYVAVASFEYTERATGNSYPGIGAYYLVTGSDGIIRMASDATTAANQSVINEVVDLPEIRQVIADVNAAYAEAEARIAGQPADTGEGEPAEQPAETGEGEQPAEPEAGGEGEGTEPAE